MNMTYIKSPFNYIGGKYKLLSQIIPLFPEEIDTFYDVFGGGGNMSLNVKSNCVYYNDIVPYVGEVFDGVKGKTAKVCLEEIDSLINKYKLDKTNRQGFEQMRKDYNDGNKTWAMFYVLTCYSFNYQYRFNNKHDYNSSFGKDRSCFSEAMRKRFISFIERLNDLDIVFDNKNYLDVDLQKATENDLVYFDPPYLIACGNYNDGKRGFEGWTQEDDIKLMNICDKLNEQGVKFALSNVLENKGKTNEILKEWSKKYTIHHLNNTYGNCNYHAKDKSNNTTDEVLIVNY